MSTVSHPRLEEIRSLIAAKARLDRLGAWSLRLCLAAVGLMAIGAVLKRLFGDASDPAAEATGGGVRPETLEWIGVAALLTTIAAILVVACWIIRGERIASRFRDCLKDPSTREVPPLDGEVIAGLRRVESKPDRVTWSSLVHPAWILVVALLIAICWIVAPRDFGRMMTVFGGEPAEGTVARLGSFGIWMDWISLLCLAVFAISVLRTMSAREITLERAPGAPRLRVTLAGLRPARTLEIPADAIRVNDPRTRASLSYEDPAGRGVQPIRLTPFSGPFGPVGRWQAERLCNDLRRRLGGT